jgi:flagellar basal-body rod modification protein FlgD
MDPISLSSTPSIGGTSSGTTTAAASSTGGQVTKNMFLQLLVAQIKNQDPLNPTDGVQFLTQLAQFQQLEQSLNMSQDMAAVRADLDKIVQQAGTPTNATQTP